MLSIEKYQEIARQNREEEKQRKEFLAKVREDELRKMGVNPNTQTQTQPKYDHPGMPDDCFVTLLYVIGMIASLIFNQWYIAWFGLTIVYGNFLTRHDNG